MGIAQDPLAQAYHLITYEGDNPTQASLRRAVSTAYYGLFHLLTEEAAVLWQGSPEATTGVARAFQHGSMKSTSLKFSGPVWQDWRGTERVRALLNAATAAFGDWESIRGDPMASNYLLAMLLPRHRS